MQTACGSKWFEGPEALPTSLLISQGELPCQQWGVDGGELAPAEVDVVVPLPDVEALADFAHDLASAVLDVDGAVDQIGWSPEPQDHLPCRDSQYFAAIDCSEPLRQGDTLGPPEVWERSVYQHPS